jgi:hypothetical protein
MKVFVSYADANRELGEKLKTALQQQGLTVWSDNHQIQPGQNWVERIEQAVRQAEAIVLLIAPQAQSDQQQSRIWQAALEAVWSDDSKRMIPFLLGDAEPPAFTRSTVPRDAQLPVIRARDPQKDWEQAVTNLAALLQHNADPAQVEHVAAWTEQDEEMHQQWDAEFTAYIDGLKATMPASPAELRANRAQ